MFYWSHDYSNFVVVLRRSVPWRLEEALALARLARALGALVKELERALLWLVA